MLFLNASGSLEGAGPVCPWAANTAFVKSAAPRGDWGRVTFSPGIPLGLSVSALDDMDLDE